MKCKQCHKEILDKEFGIRDLCSPVFLRRSNLYLIMPIGSRRIGFPTISSSVAGYPNLIILKGNLGFKSVGTITIDGYRKSDNKYR